MTNPLRTVATYVADGSGAEFDVPFPYLDRSHVVVKVGGASPVLPVEWPTPGRIRITPAPTVGRTIEIRRRTPLDPLVDFQNGAVLTEADLDLVARQALFAQQELADDYQLGLGDAVRRVAAGTNIVVGVDPDLALNQLILDLLDRDIAQIIRDRIADIDANASSIINQAGQITNINADIARIDNIIADIEGSPPSGVEVLIAAERDARIAGDTALATDLSLIGARSPSGSAWVIDLDTVTLSPTETLGQRFEATLARLDGNEAAIIDETTARTTAISAEATARQALAVRVGDAEAAITQIANANVNGAAALVQQITALDARVDTAEAAIVNEATLRVNAITAEATERQALATRVGTAESALVAEQQTRSSADSALATSITGLVTRVGTAEGAILTESTTRTNQFGSLTTSVNGLTTRVTGAESAILQEATTRAGQIDGVISNQATLRETLRVDLQNQINDRPTTGTVNTSITAAIVNERSVTANSINGAVSPIATSLTGLTTRVTGAEANIQQEATTRSQAIAGLVSSEANSRELLRADLQGQIDERPTSGAVNNAVSAAILNERSVTAGTINGAVSAEATARQVLEARVDNFNTTSPNAVVDSEFTQGLKFFGGFTATLGAGTQRSITRGINLSPDWSGMRTVFWAQVQTGVGVSWPAPQYADVLITPGTWNGGSLSDLKKFGLPIKNGDRIYYRALMAPHRCTAQLYILLFDKDGGFVGARAVTGGRQGGGGGGDPANFDVVGETFVLAGAPTAAYAVLMARMLGNGSEQPFLFLTEPAMGIVPATQTVLPPYSPGRSDPLADRTSENVAFDSNRVGGQLSTTLLSRVSTTESAIAGVSAQWGVEVNVNGHIAGIQLLNGGGRSDFTVVADNFRVINPGVSADPVFEVSGGVTRVRNAVIGMANVNTGNLANNSVTQVVSAFTEATVSYQSTTFGTIQTAVISADAGDAVDVVANFVASFQSGSNTVMNFRIVRNGTVIFSAPAWTPQYVCPVFVDFPGAGTHTYELQVANAGALVQINVSNRYMRLLRTRR